jgi:hypothetical protein
LFIIQGPVSQIPLSQECVVREGALGIPVRQRSKTLKGLLTSGTLVKATAEKIEHNCCIEECLGRSWIVSVLYGIAHKVVDKSLPLRGPIYIDVCVSEGKVRSPQRIKGVPGSKLRISSDRSHDYQKAKASNYEAKNPS